MEKTAKILIVDDDEVIRHLLMDTLSALGYQTWGAANGEEALSSLKDKKVDVVISDVRMPKLDGVNLLKKLKETHPDLPVLIITAYNFAFDQAQAFKSGADGFLAKPFRIGKMEELIKLALSQKKVNTSVPPEPSKKILVVDDDEILLPMLVETLSTLGYQTQGASNGEEALKKIEGVEFDLVITDIRMPQMDGISFLRTLKEKKPKLPVIMITGFSLAYTQQRATQEGADGYLVKPFKIEKIEELVKNLLGERKAKNSQAYQSN